MKPRAVETLYIHTHRREGWTAFICGEAVWVGTLGMNLHSALEGVVEARHVGHDLTFVRLLVVEQIYHQDGFVSPGVKVTVRCFSPGVGVTLRQRTAQYSPGVKITVRQRYIPGVKLTG